ncbi:hypothetical protein [Anabaena sp. CCY 0017]|uniref:hypothetical protein n=1 Tax=Anabaena sp. CCY 0017 TaxID=3103866 RepID=UPI0039C6F8C2
MMLKLFSLATACALLLPVASPVFAQDLDTIRVIGSRSCSGLCLDNFVRDFFNNVGNRVEPLPNEATLEADESAAEPEEVKMPIADFDNVCDVSKEARIERVNTEFRSGFGGQSLTVGTEVRVYYFPSQSETFILTSSATLKPKTPDTFQGCD